MFKKNLEAKKETKNIPPQQAYQELMAAIEQVPDIRIMTSQKTSVAWLIERIRQESPLNWQTKIREMEETVETLKKKGGKFEVSHFLKQEINDKYITFLNDRLQKETDEDIKQNLEIMIKMIKDDNQFAQQAKAQNEAISFGGVSLDYTPDWYYEIKK